MEPGLGRPGLHPGTREAVLNVRTAHSAAARLVWQEGDPLRGLGAKAWEIRTVQAAVLSPSTKRLKRPSLGACVCHEIAEVSRFVESSPKTSR